MSIRLSSVAVVMSLVASFAVAQRNDDLERFAQLRSAELRAGGRAMFLALAPGHEDLSAAARYRVVAGAQVRVVYLTNGEGYVTGASVQFPNQIAAAAREQAYLATAALEADHAFLNMPHIDGAATLDVVREAWEPDTLRARLRAQIEEFQPDLIVVNGLERPETPRVLPAEVLSAVGDVLARISSYRRYIPAIVAVAEARQRPRAAESRTRADRIANALLTSARAVYADRAVWLPLSEPRYRSLSGYPKVPLTATSNVDGLLRRTTSASVRYVDSLSRSLGSQVRRWNSLPRGTSADRLLKQAVEVLGEIDLWLQTNARDREPERRMLLDRRAALEAVRLRLIGAEAFFRVSDSVLTNTQLTHITIDSVQGLDASGDTQVFFPMVAKGWILNESNENRAALVTGAPYRIISSRDIPYDLPRELAGLEQSRFKTPWNFFIIHRSARPERSFSLRLDARLYGAPRFSVDVLTPITMAVPGEQLAVRLTNNSRDGVRDTLEVHDAYVRSIPMHFRMNAKGSTEIDTLDLTFDEGYPEGTNFSEILIGLEPVARFLVRKFPVTVDRTAGLGVLGGPQSTVTGLAIRRLGATVRWIESNALSATGLSSLQTVVVPEWAGRSLGSAGWNALREFAEQGGRVIVLAQDADVALALPGSPIEEAVPDGNTDSTTALSFKAGDRLALGPNPLPTESWEGWINRRVPHRLTLKDVASEVLLVVGNDEIPGIVRWSMGRGSYTYVNLNLHHQFLNAHPAAYRLLANLTAS